MRWLHAVVTCGGYIWWLHVVVTCGGYTRWLHDTCNLILTLKKQYLLEITAKRDQLLREKRDLILACVTLAISVSW